MPPYDAIAAAVAGGRSVLLPADLPGCPLDDIATALTGSGTRVVRVTTDAPVSLPALLAQVVGAAAGGPLHAAELEQGFALLTEPGRGFERIVLLMDRGDALDAAALRYIQFAGQDAPLQMVCRGGEALEGLLRWQEFGVLRRRFVRPEFPVGTTAPEPIAPEPAAPEPAAAAPAEAQPAQTPVTLPSPVRRSRGWARFGMAACVGLLLWLKPLPELAATLTGLTGAIWQAAAR